MAMVGAGGKAGRKGDKKRGRKTCRGRKDEKKGGWAILQHSGQLNLWTCHLQLFDDLSVSTQQIIKSIKFPQFWQDLWVSAYVTLL